MTATKAMMTGLIKKNLGLWITLKFIKSCINAKYTKTIMITTISGIALGVCILLTVLSIMNGFSDAAKTRFINILPHITINLQDDFNQMLDKEDIILLDNYDTSKELDAYTRIIKNKIGRNKIKSIYPSFQDKAFIINNNKLIPIYVIAVPSSVIEDLSKNLGQLNANLTRFKYNPPQEKKDETDNENDEKQKSKTNYYYKGIILSSKISDQLVNNNNVSFALSDNLFQIYNSDISNTFNARDQLMGNIALIDIKYAQEIFSNKILNKLNINLVNPFAAEYYANELQTEMTFSLNHWKNYVGNYFNVLEYTKQVMFLLLSVIVIVAMFNSTSNLITTINEKDAEIAILKTIGGDQSFIIKIIFYYALIFTTVGLGLGLLLGTILSLNIPFLASIIESIIGYNLVDPKIYFINFLPAKISITDIINIVLFVYFVLFIVVIYPVRKAYKISPANSLRFN